MKKGKSYQEKGGRPDRKDNRFNNDRKKDYVEITDDEAKETVLAAFKKFIDFQEKEPEDEQNQEEDEQPQKKEYDYSVFTRLQRENGRSGSSILYNLFFAVTDQPEDKLRHLTSLMDHFIKEKYFKSQDYSEGVSLLLQQFGELGLDCSFLEPMTYHHIINPLLKAKSMQLKFLKWNPPEEAKGEEEDDDVDFDTSDAQFRVVAMILNGTPPSTDLQVFAKDNGLIDFVKQRKAKIEDKASLWDQLRDEYKERAEGILKVFEAN